MEVKKTEKQTKQVDVVIESYTVCDKCNERIEQERFNAFEFNFELKTGSSYPDNGSGERKELDLCEKCALELVETLKGNGYRITESEWDY